MDVESTLERQLTHAKGNYSAGTVSNLPPYVMAKWLPPQIPLLTCRWSFMLVDSLMMLVQSKCFRICQRIKNQSISVNNIWIESTGIQIEYLIHSGSSFSGEITIMIRYFLIHPHLMICQTWWWLPKFTTNRLHRITTKMSKQGNLRSVPLLWLCLFIHPLVCCSDSCKLNI